MLFHLSLHIITLHKRDRWSWFILLTSNSFFSTSVSVKITSQDVIISVNATLFETLWSYLFSSAPHYTTHGATLHYYITVWEFFRFLTESVYLESEGKPNYAVMNR